MMRINRASGTITQHLIHFNLIPRPLTIGSDSLEVVSIKQCFPGIHGDAGDAKTNIISKAGGKDQPRWMVLVSEVEGREVTCL